MSVERDYSWHLRCDFPGCTTSTGDLGEYGAFGSESEAVEDWRESEGYAGTLGTYCPAHTLFEPDPLLGPDNERDGEYRPMLPTIDNLFRLARREIAHRIDYAERTARYRHDGRIRDWAKRDGSIERRIAAQWHRLPDTEVETLAQRSRHLVAISRAAVETVHR